jgi:subtilisin family serine protease
MTLLLVFSGTAMASPPDRINVIIGFDRTPGPAEQALVRGYGGDIKSTYSIVPGISASIPETAIRGLLRNPKVLAVQPDIQVSAVDVYPWGIEKIGADIVHGGNNYGGGVSIAVIDSGIDYNNPEFAGIYAGGYDFVDDDPYPMDLHGHGTHVAGIIAADVGSGEVIGVAPGVTLYALRVLDQNGSGYFSDIIDAVQWASGGVVERNGQQIQGVRVDITNNSYGSVQNPDLFPFLPFVEGAFEAAYSLDGVLHVAAAGNEGGGENIDSVIYPAKYSSVIAVAATDINNDRAGWSSTGPDIEIAAPGVAIKSTILGGTYEYWSGTSMACPHVAGTAALVMAENPAWSNEQVRIRLQQTADDLGDLGRDNLYGHGLVDADEAVEIGQPPAEMGVTDLITGMFTGRGKNKAFTEMAEFSPGDDIIVRVCVKDEFGNGLTNAIASLEITGPATVTLDTGLSDNDGWAEAVWKTTAPKKKTVGTAPGAYRISLINLTAGDCIWDEIVVTAGITVD